MKKKKKLGNEKDIQEKYRAGKLILGESKQVDKKIRAVLVDADTKVRVKDVTFKKVKRTGRNLPEF